MASLISSLIYTARQNLKEPTPIFWSDQELIDIANKGAKDLWRAIVDLYEHHFVTVSEAPYINANSPFILGIPDDVYRVVLIEPRTIGDSSSNPGLIFKPLPYTDPRFLDARARSAIEPREDIVYWTQMEAGAPVGPPVIRIGPQLSSSANLTMVYNHVLPVFDEDDYNPIPGEADGALVAWMTAYARAKERDDTAPDPVWLKVYATEKQNLIRQIPPRQIQEPEYVYGMFEGYQF